jgi:protein-L-isoaspartate(D-aspartate) O-methyltransferase
MFFNRKKNRTKERIPFIKNNSDLLEELKEKGISDKNILDAIKKVPRELFVNKISIQCAYENIPLPVDCEQTISQPYVVAYMIDCLKLKKTDTVLEIGTGTGYQTAIISHLCKKIYTIEIFNKLFNLAKFNIDKLKIKNIIYKLGNGVNGWGDKNFFDAIIVSAASEEIPPQLLQNLKINGKLIFPKKYPFENQKLILIKKIGENNFEKKELFDVKFVPLLNKNAQH